MVLKGHSQSVANIKKLSNKHLISGSSDKTIKIWEIESGSCLKTLKGHQKTVECVVILSVKKIASGSLDKTIKV